MTGAKERGSRRVCRGNPFCFAELTPSPTSAADHEVRVCFSFFLMKIKIRLDLCLFVFDIFTFFLFQGLLHDKLLITSPKADANNVVIDCEWCRIAGSESGGREPEEKGGGEDGHGSS